MSGKAWRTISLWMILYLCICCFFLSEQTWAERKLTLEESIKIALKNNKNVLSAKTDIFSAKSKVIQAKSGFFPQVEARGSYTWWEKVQTINMPAGTFGSPQPMSMKLDFTRDYVITLGVTQPLFTWGRVRNSYQVANIGVKATEEKYREVKQKVILSTEQAFYHVLLAGEFVKVSQEALALAEEHLRISQVRYEAGEASEFDVLRAEVEVENLKPQMVKAKNGLELATLAFKNTLGIELEEKIEIEGEFSKISFEKKLEECIKTALNKRPELTQIYYQKQMVDRSIKLAKATNKPSLVGTFNYQNWSDEVFNRKKWNDSYSGFLVVSVPIFDGFYTKGKVKESESARDNINIIETQIKDGIDLEVRQAFLGVEESKKILGSTEDNIRQAQRSVEIAEEQFASGVVTSLDVMSSQLALTQAKTNHVQALHDYLLWIAKLKKAMGVID